MTTIDDDLRWALDPVMFARESLGIEPDPWQARVLRWSGKRLLMSCGRQSGKSTIAAVLALHTAIYQPGALALLVSPSLRQSSELFRKITDLRDAADQLRHILRQELERRGFLPNKDARPQPDSEPREG